MFLLIAWMTLAEPAAAPFPERTPALIEDCLANALETDGVSETDDSHKYLCVGEPAERFWSFLERAGIEPWEQDAGDEGVWLSRDFPLGACFKRTRMADGTGAKDGLSCSIWIPRRVAPTSGDHSAAEH
ncbi:hypothetical protein [Sphingosinicella sp. BN140058]|uniref:hypothetical protein n=1 Tax=Sphingosinicella sp. BN140058 TaxID=1892855 RepID=UPI0010116413|nr:hypothetical protein [Sphingosinicella sp. BN140058]QAY77248.1 hypothetical protein ETR14_12610 [Sphingosinicella sp. BN140058]